MITGALILFILIAGILIGWVVRETWLQVPPDLIIYDDDGRHLCEIRTYRAGAIYFVEAIDISNGKNRFQTWSEYERDAKSKFLRKLELRGYFEIFNDDKLK